MHGPKSAKIRLDLLLVQRGFAGSRQRAQAMLLAGHVRVNGQSSAKAGALVAQDAAIEITGEPMRYVSRGGLKIEGALADFRLSPEGKVCLDAGSSTGGFTDCLLRHGAERVYAIDVNTRQLDWKLKKDSRVVPIEMNARNPMVDAVAEPVDLITADLSFISIAKVLPSLVAVAKPAADFLILIKPQFELDRGDIGKGGIVRNVGLHQKAIDRVLSAAIAAGLQPIETRPSRLPGAEGNREFFLHARRIG